MERLGPLEEFHLVYKNHKFKSKHKGYGFIKFGDLESTKNALKNSKKFKLNNNRIVFSFSKMARNMGKGGIKERIGCWFCLDNPEADKSLVSYQTENVYLALDKGPIDNYHFLAIPQEHIENSLKMCEEAKDDIKTIDKKLQEFYQQEGKSFIKFERFFSLSKKISHMMV